MVIFERTMNTAAPSATLNFNVGVLGHIDSGKTSICRAISTTASTAAFDKNPQSQERGITLDLGFSCFSVPVPSHLLNDLSSAGISSIQYTLVDCPGHASLIRTIISGAQIIDLMLLVVDVTKGIQTQTAECLVIGEITCGKMVVVLNKIDLLPAEKRQLMIEKMTVRLKKTLEATKFSGCPIVPFATRSGTQESEDKTAIGLNDLIEVLKNATFIPKREPNGSMLFSVDHCFSIRGQGTIMTGTMLSGTAKVADVIEIVTIGEVRKIKSMQMFRHPVQQAVQGDRVGICVPNFDAKLLERGFVATPGTLRVTFAVVVFLRRISYFKQIVKSRTKFHISIGHETVMGKIQLFTGVGSSPPAKFDFAQEYNCLDELPEDETGGATGSLYALIELETQTVGQCGQLIIASRLDADIHLNACRLAFSGIILEMFTDKNYHCKELSKLRIFRLKEKKGVVDRVQDSQTIIVRNLVKKETNMTKFESLKIHLSTGEVGVIEGAFGKSGKIKVRIPDGLKESTVILLNKSLKKKGTFDDAAETVKSHEAASDDAAVFVVLQFKRFIYDEQKKMIQS